MWLDGLEVSNRTLFDQIHVFSTFFYKKLSSGESYVTAITTICLPSFLPSPQNCYERVCKWVKCDIFQKKYLIVPINEKYHWYLAIIYEPEHVIKCFNSDEPTKAKSIHNIPKLNYNNVYGYQTNGFYRTYIFSFDSLGVKRGKAVEKLTRYLEMEAKYKKGVDVPGKVDGKTALVRFLLLFPVPAIKPGTQVPLQPNSYDCGIYLLHFVETFMSDPIKYANTILVRYIGHSSVWCTDSVQACPPEFETLEARRRRWLVNPHFALNKRDELRLKIEALSMARKSTSGAGKNHSNGSPITSMGDDESEGEVEVVRTVEDAATDIRSLDWPLVRFGIVLHCDFGIYQ